MMGSHTRCTIYLREISLSLPYIASIQGMSEDLGYEYVSYSVLLSCYDNIVSTCTIVQMCLHAPNNTTYYTDNTGSNTTHYSVFY